MVCRFKIVDSVLIILVMIVMFLGLCVRGCVVVDGIISMVMISRILIILMVMVIMIVRLMVRIICLCFGLMLLVFVKL